MSDAELEEWMEFVRKICFNFRRHVFDSVELEEIESAGMSGLALALRDFNPDKGIPFERFCNMKVTWAIRDMLRRHSFLGRRVRQKGSELARVRRELAHQLLREPTPQELAAELDMTVEQLTALEDKYVSVVCLDETVGGNGGTRADLLQLTSTTYPDPLNALMRREQVGYVRSAIMALKPKHRAVILSLYFFEERSSCVAERLKVTETRVSQLAKEARNELRVALFALLFPELSQASSSLTYMNRRQEAVSASGMAGLWQRLTCTDIWGEPVEQFPE